MIFFFFPGRVAYIGAFFFLERIEHVFSFSTGWFTIFGEGDAQFLIRVAYASSPPIFLLRKREALGFDPVFPPLFLVFL